MRSTPDAACRWARGRARVPRQTVDEIASAQRSRAEAARASFLDVSTGQLPGRDSDNGAVKGETAVKAETVNPFKRTRTAEEMRAPLAAPSPPSLQSHNPWSVQVCAQFCCVP